jgi:hypothetical protein
MKHIITEKEIKIDEPIRTELAGSYGKGSKKTLHMCILPFTKRVWFTVTDHRVEIANVPELTEAIDIYNRLK